MDKYLNTLQDMGLSEKESRVYLALLELGKASGYAVAEKAKVKRPTTYVILTELMQKGLVLKIPRAKKQNFIAKSPDEFFRVQEEKIFKSKRLLPEFMAIAGNVEQKVKVMYYEGLKGMEEATRYGQTDLENKEVVGFFATAENISPELWKICEDWGERLFKDNLRVRGFAPEHFSLKRSRELDVVHGNMVRSLPYSDYSSEVSIDVGSTFIRIMMNGDMQAVIIKNPQLAKAFREIFEMVWKKY